MFTNPNCNGSHCIRRVGEVRRVPLMGRDDNTILCRECFDHEMNFRKTLNEMAETSKVMRPEPHGEPVKVLTWDECEVYKGE